MLDERKIKVLKAIISSYIITAEPIGSRTISKDYDLGVSSATIRNEMSDLEDLGYLNKPHASAGRVPSDKAYRLYVDHIMSVGNEEPEENSYNLYELLKEESKELEDIVINSSKLLSAITSYTTLAISPQAKKEKLKHIQLISLGNSEILVVLVTESGLVKNALYQTNEKIDKEDLNVISNLLNSKLKGLDNVEIKLILDRELMKDLPFNKDIIKKLIPIIDNSLNTREDIKIYTTGIDKIFNYPEYNDMEKAKSFVSFIENRDMLLELLLKSSFNKGIEISIGQENTMDPLKESSLVTATYKLGDKTIGKLGVVGPTRMDYFTVINALNIFSYTLTEMLNSKE